MFKFVVPAFLGLALLLPTAADAYDHCGYSCHDSQCCKPRKRLAVACVTKEVCRLRLVCVTDECGRTRHQLARVPTTVTRKRLVLVDRDCGCGHGFGCGCGG